MIKIQEEDFNIEKEIISIKSKYSNIGATSIFIGYVRDTNDNKEVTFLKLEVYFLLRFTLKFRIFFNPIIAHS